MYEDIKRNKLKTGVVVFTFLIIITLIIYYICYIMDLGVISIVIALIFSIISTIATYYNCDKIVLASVNARPANKEEDLQLTNILEGLMITADIPVKPKLYVIDSSQANAFATGRNPENAIICVTKGLLEKLDYYELEGVIAHELAHIKNYDIRLSAIISVMAGFVIMLADFCTRRIYRRNTDRDSDSKANGILLLIGAICLILSPIISQMIQLAVSRRREYLADATAISFTRNPNGLISALIKLGSDDSELNVASNSEAHMYIVTPFKNKKKKEESSLFSTHPSISERVEAIRKLQ
ncbi:MAG: M48 family metallopeptidase [Clostridia bacterium]|nr:M48 family metallopeptidase [Clostridia bacterium]